MGAANALIAETSQNSMSPDCGDSEDDSDNQNGDNSSAASGDEKPKIDLPKINLGSDPDFNANITSKRYIMRSQYIHNVIITSIRRRNDVVYVLVIKKP